MALTALHHQSVAVFYEKLYSSLSENVKQSINDALLNYAKNVQIKQAACSRMAQAIQGRLKNEESVESLVPELQWYTENVTENLLQKNLKKSGVIVK